MFSFYFALREWKSGESRSLSSKLSEHGKTGCVIRARERKVFESIRTFSATRMVKAGAMALKAVVPGIPKSAKDRDATV